MTDYGNIISYYIQDILRYALCQATMRRSDVRASGRIDTAGKLDVALSYTNHFVLNGWFSFTKGKYRE